MLKEVQHKPMARTAAPPQPGTDQSRKLNIVLPGRDFNTLHAYAQEHSLPLTIALRDMISFYRDVHSELDKFGEHGEIVVQRKRAPAEGEVSKIRSPR
jgi:hypothetical protein